MYKSCCIVNNGCGGTMKTIYCSWKDEEIKKLFGFVEEGKQKHLSLLSIFKNYAEMTKRKPNSVRNYYYVELGQLQNDKSKCQRLGINLKNHEKIKQTPFDEKEEKEVVKNILRLCAKGSSVRKACLKLAGDDLGKMIRFQNKYRNVLKGNQALLSQCIKELKDEGIEVNIKQKVTPRPNNILVMPKQKGALSDKDIEALFMGLVRLVKRVANEQAEVQNRIEMKRTNDNLAKAYVELSSKESEIKSLSTSLEKLKTENKNLKTCLQEKRIKEAENYVESSRMRELKNFANAFPKKNRQKLKA